MVMERYIDSGGLSTRLSDAEVPHRTGLRLPNKDEAWDPKFQPMTCGSTRQHYDSPGRTKFFEYLLVNFIVCLLNPFLRSRAGS
jgi:hypothetical protein